MSEDSISWRFSPSSSSYIFLATSSIMFSVHWRELDKDISRRMKHLQSLFLDILTRYKALHWLFTPRPRLRATHIYRYKHSLFFNFVILSLAIKPVCEELTEISRTSQSLATGLYLKDYENPSKRLSSSLRLLEQSVIGYFISCRNIFLTVLKNGKFRVKSPIDSMLFFCRIFLCLHLLVRKVSSLGILVCGYKSHF